MSRDVVLRRSRRNSARLWEKEEILRLRLRMTGKYTHNDTSFCHPARKSSTSLCSGNMLTIIPLFVALRDEGSHSFFPSSCHPEAKPKGLIKKNKILRAKALRMTAFGGDSSLRYRFVQNDSFIVTLRQSRRKLSFRGVQYSEESLIIRWIWGKRRGFFGRLRSLRMTK